MKPSHQEPNTIAMSRSWKAAWNNTSWLDGCDDTTNENPKHPVSNPISHIIWGAVELDPVSQSSEMTPSCSFEPGDPKLGQLPRLARERFQNHALQFLDESQEFSSTIEHEKEVFSANTFGPNPPEPGCAAWDDDSCSDEEGEASECRAHPKDTKVNSMTQHEQDQLLEQAMQTRHQFLAHQKSVASWFAHLSKEEAQELKSHMPLDEQGEMTSVGSISHRNGSCRQCLFHHTKVGCQNGILCDFCHFSHSRKTKSRPGRGKRDRYRKLIGRMEQAIDIGPGPVSNAQEVEQFKPPVLSELIRHMQELHAKAGDDELPDGIDENTKIQVLPSSIEGMAGEVQSRNRKRDSISL